MQLSFGSITGDKGGEITGVAGSRPAVCVTCPQGMAWETDGHPQESSDLLPRFSGENPPGDRSASGTA
ncbi:hypothetical protein ASZ90_016402 [hydrocarbon metagenome]|uniref:Uncharacterized protein n=1 Tax=hydrocarbon metagenome TaxID=938273 RepID=A0A0W8EX88_9ZZZZ